MSDVTIDPLKSQLDFLWKTHDYINNYIRFSDTKAALVLAFSSGFIASLVTHKLHLLIRRASLGWPFDLAFSLRVLCSSISFLLLASAAGFAILSILPRMRTQPSGKHTLWGFFRLVSRWVGGLFVAYTDIPKGPIYWGSILAYGSQVEYSKAIQNMGLSEQVQAVADHLYVLAGISDEKYRLVNRSIFLAVLGSVIASLLILTTPGIAT